MMLWLAMPLALFFALSACTPMHAASTRAEDEAFLRRAAADVDQASVDAGLVWHDHSLDSYLASVTAKLLTASHATLPDVRIRVIRDPALGASALANGAIHVNTGMLARLDNEAQLATLLAHELAHLIGCDALRELEWSNTTRVSAGASGGPASRPGGNALVESYERDLEHEADAAALRMILAAGYDAGEATRFFEILVADEAGQHACSESGNHPPTRGRLDLCRERVSALTAGGSRRGAIARGRYEDAIASMLLENATLQISLGLFDGARADVGRHLRIHPGSAPGLFFAAEIARLAHAGISG